VAWGTSRAAPTSAPTRLRALMEGMRLRALGSSIGRCFCSAPPALDAFYGEAWNIESRTDEWSEKLYLNASRPKRRRLSASTSTRSSLLDRALLRDLGAHATSFMAAVRQLPYFKKDWNKKELTVRVGPLLLADGRLDARERKFLQKLAKAQEILEARPLCAQDKRDVLLCLCRFVPGSAARVVSQFVFHPHEMARPAAT